jgi:hypothetical protein
MPILQAGTIEFVHTEQVSALFTFHLGQVLLYIKLYNFFSFLTLTCKNWPSGRMFKQFAQLNIFVSRVLSNSLAQ